MIKKYKSVLCILLFALLLTGCWDYKDINRRSITLSVGVDEINDELEFAGEIAKLAAKTSKSKEKVEITDSYEYNSIGKYFEGSRESYDARIPLEDFSGAQRVVVFSQKYAEKGIKSYINRLYNIQQFRSSALIAVSKEPTREFFKGKVENDISVGYAVENTIRYLSNNGAALYKTIQQITSDIYFGNIGYMVPYITKNEKIVEYLGLAAMKDSKLVGIINRQESTGFLFILLEKPVSTMVIAHPSNNKNLLSIRTELKKRNIKTTYEDKGVNIYIDLNLKSQLSYPYKIEPISEEDTKKIESFISEKIKKDVLSALERSKNEFKCDIFGFGRYFKAQNPKEYKKIKWQQEYLKANFHVKVNTKIINTNLIDTNAKKQD